MRDLISFPNPVNEKAARTVAGAVLVTIVVILATGWYWLLVPLGLRLLGASAHRPPSSARWAGWPRM